MKHITNGDIASLSGKPFKVPERDESDDIVWDNVEETMPRMVIATPYGILKTLIFSIPAQVLTRQDSIHATRLYSQLVESAKNGNGRLEIEDGEWDWVIKKLEDDKVGPRIFGISLHAVETALKGLEVSTKASKDEKGGES